MSGSAIVNESRHRGLAGRFERSWSGEKGTVPWTKALHTLEVGYALASGVSRRRAAARRRALPGAHVVAVGNLTVGGTGKSTVARWLALEAVAAGARASVLLRGHGASVAGSERGVVPDFDGFPLEERVHRYGDEAVALRRALPRQVSVAADPDRWRAARVVQGGYGARVLILDDGWEQPHLMWDELWVTLDPKLPEGNGSLLPAGPLRRPATALREADRIVFLLEEADEAIPEETLGWLARVAPGIPQLRLRRALGGTTPIHERGPVEPLPHGARVAIVSGVGAPSRIERFLRGAGADLRLHAAFADHARWSTTELTAAVERARDAGAECALITEKDEARWPAGVAMALPVRVIRTAVSALDPTEQALRAIRAAALQGRER